MIYASIHHPKKINISRYIVDDKPFYVLSFEDDNGHSQVYYNHLEDLKNLKHEIERFILQEEEK